MNDTVMSKQPKVWNYRWEDFSHEALYANVRNDVNGAAAIEATAGIWSDFTAMMTESRDAVERLLQEVGVSWRGGSADSMAAGVSPLAAWADQAAIAGQQTQSSLQRVAEAFTHTANAMPEPVPVPSKATQGIPTSFHDMVAGQTDEDAVDQQAQEAHLRAIDLMTSYNAQNQDSAASTGTFVEPQAIGVSAQADGGLGRSGSDIIETSPGDDISGESGGPGSGGPGGGGPSGGPSGSSSPSPGSQPGPSAGNPGSTDTAGVQAPSAPSIPSGGGTPQLPSTSPPPVSHPFAPIAGVLNEPGRGAMPGGGRGAGGGGRSGGMPGTGGGPGAGGSPAPGRGGMVSAGPLAAAEVAAARAGAGRAGGPGAFGAMGGAGAGQKDEDKERKSAEYLRDYNDEFWDDSPPVAPPVIGEDDD